VGPSCVGIRFFPKLIDSRNPYWRILQTGLEGYGLRFVDADEPRYGLRWLCRYRSEIQVIHFHYIQRFYAYEGTNARLRWVLRFARNLVVARSLGYRTVFTLHNLTPTYPLIPRWVDYLGHWVVANLTDAVIAHCAYARQLLARRYGRRRNVHVVNHPHYIDVYPHDISREGAREALGFPRDRLVFLFLGGIRPNKGIETLVTAFTQLADVNLSLLIAGKPWRPLEYVEALEHAVSRDPRIILHKRFVPDEELQVYFGASDVVVLPFERILSSGSAILAMGFARPVVAPAMGCLLELIPEGAGILYDPSDPSGLLRALSHCVAIRPALMEIGEQARATVSRYSAQSVAEDTLRAYGMAARGQGNTS